MDTETRFAGFVATLGRGPGRSRALTRAEAREAFAMVLAGEAASVQVGAFLMLLRYRGEDPEEVAGLVEAARAVARLADMPPVALDWPSYGAGRTRDAPWFLLAALAVGQAGIPVLMHGSNEFSTGLTVADGLAALGLAPALDPAAARRDLAARGFAYLPLAAFAPALERLLQLRRLLGLRSPVNTVARLLDPADAPAAVDGVFHPPYIEVHLGVAERLGRERLLVLKGGGGEAERNPAKPATIHLWRNGIGRSELILPALSEAASGMPAEATPDAAPDSAVLFAAVWRGEASPPALVAKVVGTIALALLATGRVDSPAEADAMAAELWGRRRVA